MLNRVAVGHNLAYYAPYLHDELKHSIDNIRSCVGVRKLRRFF